MAKKKNLYEDIQGSGLISVLKKLFNKKSSKKNNANSIKQRTNSTKSLDNSIKPQHIFISRPTKYSNKEYMTPSPSKRIYKPSTPRYIKTQPPTPPPRKLKNIPRIIYNTIGSPKDFTYKSLLLSPSHPTYRTMNTNKSLSKK